LASTAYANPPRLNDLNPYSLDADGWCEPTSTRVEVYDRRGPPVDERASLHGARGGRSRLAAHLATLALQPPQTVDWAALWQRWSLDPRRDVVAALFPCVTATDAAALRAEVGASLVRTTRAEARPIADRLAATGLADADARVVLDLLVELRLAWTTRSSDVADAGYDDLNWRHTCGELAQLLELAQTMRLPASVVVDAALASLLSDAAKLRGNFLTHHIDGALAAFVVLPRVLAADTAAGQRRIAGICQAILEHQVGPPRFMAIMVRLAILAALRAGGVVVDEAVSALVDGLRDKIADPMNPAHVVRAADGTGVLKVSADEAALLARVQLPAWYVPHPLTPWFQASSTVIDADSLVNYATPDGVGKIVAICGPGTPFQDATVFHSMFSCGASFVDAVSVMSDEAMSSVEQGLKGTRAVIDHVRAIVAAELVRGWLQFPAASFDRIAAEEHVHVERLRVVRTDAAVCVAIDKPADGLPYWSMPLRYDDDGVDAHVARLLRRKVADLLRAV
jgi:hypothetical protein